MTPLQPIGAMSSSRVILGELLSSRARLRFPGQAQAQPSTPVRQVNLSERHTGLFQTVSLKGFNPPFLWMSRTQPGTDHPNPLKTLLKIPSPSLPIISPASRIIAL
jgi:hypothetical protein